MVDAMVELMHCKNVRSTELGNAASADTVPSGSALASNPLRESAKLDAR